MKPRNGRVARTVSALAITAALAAPGVRPDAASALTPNPLASSLATLVAHQPIQAVCGTSETDWQTAPGVAYWTSQGSEPDGTADIPNAAIYLSPWVCQHLATRTPDAGIAVTVVVHEAIHVSLYSWDEALVECVAGQNYWPAIHALGFSHKLERAAYQAAWGAHLTRANDPTGTYDWRGHC